MSASHTRGHRRSQRIAAAAFALLASLCSAGHAFETSTHRRITDRAIIDARPLVDSRDGPLSLEDVLVSRYGLASGLGTVLSAMGATRTAQAWTAQGSEAEDDSINGLFVVTRFINHFHDPTCPWGQAGLSPGESALLWAQNPEQAALGHAPVDRRSWRDLRKWLWKALTDPARPDRNVDWAQAFKTLGHQAHLVQDMASPAHTRNDPHPTWNPDSLHEWAQTHEDLIDRITSEEIESSFSDALVAGPAGDGVSLPIANLFDSTDDLPDPLSAGTDIGLAQYSNQHYFSDDAATISPAGSVASCHVFAHPSETEVTTCPDDFADPDTGRTARYVCESVGGQNVVIGRLSPLTLERLANQRVKLDERAWQSFVPILLKRAVGYSAGLMSYAFRGNFDFCVGVNTGESIIKNAGTEPMKGTFGIYYDDAQGMRHLLTTWDTTDSLYLPASAGGLLGPGEEMHVTFYPPDASQPAPAEPGTYKVVFRGDLGDEKSAGGDDPGAVFARTVDSGMSCRESMWQWTSQTTLSEYLVGANGVPQAAPVHSVEVPVPSGTQGSGIAVDPTTGLLWYTVLDPTHFPPGEGNGEIFQIDPQSGTVAQAIHVTGTAPPSANGSPHNQLAGIAVDPFDREHLWVADLIGDQGSNYVYQVDKADGRVVRTCRVSDYRGGIANAANTTISVGRYGLFVAPRFGGIIPPSDVLTYSRLCGATGAFRLAPPLPTQPETWIFAVAPNAYDQLVVGAFPPSGDPTSMLFYNLGDPNTFYQSIVGASPLFPSGPILGGNFAFASRMP
jgi:hypothetical protein